MFPDLTLTQWAAVGGLLAGVGGMATAVITLLVVTLGRKRVQLWVHDVHSSWRIRDRYGNGDDVPWVTFRVSNVGDGTALRIVAMGSVKLHVLKDGRASDQFQSLAMLDSGESIVLGAAIPIDEWESASVRLRWRVAPMWWLVSSRQKTLRLAKHGDRPQASYSAHDEWGKTVDRYFPTMEEAAAAQATEEGR